MQHSHPASERINYYNNQTAALTSPGGLAGASPSLHHPPGSSAARRSVRQVGQSIWGRQMGKAKRSNYTKAACTEAGANLASRTALQGCDAREEVHQTMQPWQAFNTPNATVCAIRKYMEMQAWASSLKTLSACKAPPWPSYRITESLCSFSRCEVLDMKACSCS